MPRCEECHQDCNGTELLPEYDAALCAWCVESVERGDTVLDRVNQPQHPCEVCDGVGHYETTQGGNGEAERDVVLNCGSCGGTGLDSP